MLVLYLSKDYLCTCRPVGIDKARERPVLFPLAGAPTTQQVVLALLFLRFGYGSDEDLGASVRAPVETLSQHPVMGTAQVYCKFTGAVVLSKV